MSRGNDSAVEIPFAEEREEVRRAERIVVKVGTNLLTGGSGGVSRRYVEALARSLGELHARGRKVLLVTSGAIGAGLRLLNRSQRPKALPALQALAAVGQVELMRLYALAFRKCRPPLPVAQLLLTRDGLEDRHRYLNAKNTIEELWADGVLPIVNENDTVSVDELCFGNNDLLSVLVADVAGADLAVLLTVVPGLLKEPGVSEEIVDVVPKITPKIEALARPTTSSLGTGGMKSKLEAAKVAAASGLPLILAAGRRPRLLTAVVEGRRVGTYFPSSGRRLPARKRWLAFAGRPRGRLQLDAGARTALTRRHKSLLPSGIVAVEGAFSAGALVALCAPDGAEFARGLSNYSAAEIKKIRGRNSKDIPELLGRSAGEEIVHCDNLVLL